MSQLGGGMMPLGGEGEAFSGYKGYGLAVLVDIMTAVTSGGLFGRAVMDTEATSARVCHFFGAIRLDVFRDPVSFKKDMDDMLDQLNNLQPADGCERVWYAGQKEHESEAESNHIGVPLTQKVAEQLSSRAVADDDGGHGALSLDDRASAHGRAISFRRVVERRRRRRDTCVARARGAAGLLAADERRVHLSTRPRSRHAPGGGAHHRDARGRGDRRPGRPRGQWRGSR